MIHILVLAALLVIGCGDSGPRYDVGSVIPMKEGVDAHEIWLAAGYEVVSPEPGALPDVSAEMGGAGFAELADDLGWQTPGNPVMEGDPSARVGGRFNMRIQEYPATLRSEGKDSHTAFQRIIINACYETLLNLSEDNLQYEAMLATHWKVEDLPDGSQNFYFRINPDARWQTGHRVTAEDVRASWRLKVDEGLLRLSDAVIYREFAEPEVVSPYIVKTHVDRSSWRMLMNFAAAMYIYPAHIIGDLTGKEYMERFQNDPLPGSGRYLIRQQDIRQGNSLAMTRITNYWDKDNPFRQGQYNFYQVRFTVVGDDNLSREKVKKGELDLYTVTEAKYWTKDLVPEKIDQLAKGWLIKKKVFNDQPGGMQGFVFNTREWPFDDIRVRKAVALLMNRGSLIEKIFHHQYLPIDSYYPGSMYENPENVRVRWNPEEAVRLLEEAGYTEIGPDGIRMDATGRRLAFDLMSPEAAASERLLTVLQEDLKRGGIEMSLKPTTFSTRIKMLTDRKFKVYYGAWTGAAFPDPRSSWHSDFAIGTDTGNHPGVIDPLVDSLVTVYDITFDLGERIGQLQMLDKQLMDGYYLAHAWYGPYSRLLYWKKFGMPETVLSRTGDYRSLIRLWWYDPDNHQELIDAVKANQPLPLEPVDINPWD